MSFHRDCSREPDFDADGVQASSGLSSRGLELPDSTPMAVPLELQSSGPSLTEQIRRMVRGELSNLAAESGAETFEEAEDFDIEDDPADPHTRFEAVFDPPPQPSQVIAGEEEGAHRDAPDDEPAEGGPNSRKGERPRAVKSSGSSSRGKKKGSPRSGASTGGSEQSKAAKVAELRAQIAELEEADTEGEGD